MTVLFDVADGVATITCTAPKCGATETNREGGANNLNDERNI